MIFRVKKPGHALVDVAADFPESVLRGLRNDFSITTAEELISADRISGERLRESLAVDPSKWTALMKEVRAVLPPHEVQRLTTTIPARPGGAKLTKLSPQQLKRYAGGLTRQ